MPSSSVPAPLQRHSTSTSHGTNSGMSDYSHGHDEVDQLDDDDATDNGLLLSTALHNPADALRLLASASSAMLDRGNNEAAAPSPPETSATLGWRDWHLIKIGRVNVQETQTLFRLSVRVRATALQVASLTWFVRPQLRRTDGTAVHASSSASILVTTPISPHNK